MDHLNAIQSKHLGTTKHTISCYMWLFDEWSITEFGDALDTGDETVMLHYIIDFSQIKMVPGGLMARLSEIKAKMRGSGGMAVFVGVNPMLRVPLMMFSRLNQNVTIRYAENHNEAASLIKQFQAGQV